MSGSRLLRSALSLTCLVALVSSQAVRASVPLGDLDISKISLAVNSRGEALLAYTRQNGQVRHVLAWGAVNALPPSQEVPQVHFRMDYSGGWKKYGNPSYWKHFRNECRPYDGPALVDLVVACDAPDGSYWALQAWQRLLPMRGFDPWKPMQSAVDFDLSHWTGATAILDVTQNWTYGGRWQGIDGRLTYGGTPVFGYTTASTTRRGDGYGRSVYIDTFNSVYGSGWRHDTAISLHVGDGAFCYSFVPQRPPPGYPSSAPRGPGNGQLERVTVIGPGVTPDVQWVGPGLGPYNPTQDQLYNARFDALVGPNDKVCANER
jgi:hypothetical protein